MAERPSFTPTEAMTDLSWRGRQITTAHAFALLMALSKAGYIVACSRCGEQNGAHRDFCSQHGKSTS